MRGGRFLRIGALGAFAILSTLAMSGESKAGYKAAPTDAYCTKKADGSGLCVFTLAGVRNDSNSNDIIGTNYWTSSGLPGSLNPGANFIANIGGSSYTCNAPAGPVLDHWPSAMSSRQWMQINWDSSGRCIDFGITNFSDYGNY